MSKWCNRRNSEKALSVLKEWIKLNGKPMKVMHMMVVENLHLLHSKIILSWNKEDKQIPKGYPQEQGKVEACTTR